MPRTRTIRIAALNIRSQPHSKDGYVALLQRAVASRLAAKMRGVRAVSLATIFARGDEWHYGHLNSYIDLDESKPWLNTDSGRVASAEEVEAVRIPKNLKPEFEVIRYAFNAKTHRFYFDTRLAQPSTLQRGMHAILNAVSVRRDMGPIRVGFEQDQSTIERILGLPKLLRLQITVALPNPDDFEEAEKAFVELLNKEGADSVTTEWTAAEGGTLTPTEETIRAMNVAVRGNGEVRALGRNEQNRSHELHTKKRPALVDFRFDPKETPIEDAILDASKKMEATLNEWPEE